MSSSDCLCHGRLCTIGKDVLVFHHHPVMQPLECCRERVGTIAQGGVILIAWAAIHYLDFVLNWLELLGGWKVTGYMVGALDDELLKARIKLHVSPIICAAWHSGCLKYSHSSLHDHHTARIQRNRAQNFNLPKSHVFCVYCKMIFGRIKDFLPMSSPRLAFKCRLWWMVGRAMSSPCTAACRLED